MAKDITLLEAVQKRATKLVKAIRDLSYEERLQALDLYSLKQRRERGDLILLFKIMKGLVNIDATKMFELSSYGSTRGHQYKLKVKKTCRTDIGRNSFSHRVVLPWNALPDSIVKCESVDAFKREYDKYIIKTNM